MESDSVASSALLVVDMQHDFIDGSLAIPGAVGIINRVNFWIEVFEDLERPIIYSLDWHPEETPHFDRWPAHCVAKTNGAQIHEDVIYDPTRSPQVYTVLKGLGSDGGYSVCSTPSDVFSIGRAPTRERTYEGVMGVLAHEGVEIVYVVGLATDHCVRASVLDLLKLGMKVVVILDAVVGVNRDVTQEAIKEMTVAGARFMLGESITPISVDSRVSVPVY